MKKSNVLVIASVLVVLHLLAFFVLIGRDKDSGHKPVPQPAPTTAKREPTPAPSKTPPSVEPKVPELNLMPEQPVPAPAQQPSKPEPVHTASTKPRELIAVPDSHPGYLRNDRPNNRTSKIYSKLVGDPYQGAIVVDARSGKILYENRATAYAYPASVTKMMTFLVVMEQVDAGAIKLTDRVEITKEVSNIGGSEVYLDPRESGQFTVHNLLQALMIHSANDAARALALHVAGNRDAFVDMMNRKARELGMNSTVYHSEHGLPPSDGTQPDISTPYDIAILSLAVLRHPMALEYTGTKLAWLPTSSIREERFMLANRNALVGKDPYPGCDGLKTGYHSRGGYSLAATATRGDERVVAVVLGVPDRNTRNDTIRQLMDKGFEKLK